MKLLTFLLTFCLSVASASAFEVQKVTDDIYALVGEKAQRSPTNLANNSTHGVIITNDGVVLVDPG